MSYFEREKVTLDPAILLECILIQALEVLGIGDETSIEEIALHKKGARIIARERGLTVEDRESFRKLEEYEQALAKACQEGDPYPDPAPYTPLPADILDILWSLFDLSVTLEDTGERMAILDLAAYMMDFLDLAGRLHHGVPRSA